MAELRLQNIKKRFGKITVLKDINLKIEQGEFIVFVGPSGCGKSTLLRMIAGLETITAGELLFEGQRVNETPPSMRGIAMVFQTYALYPHMSVFDNMAFGLRVSKTPKKDIQERVNAAAQKLQLSELLNRLPKELSGGQRQRVAIGRAIVRNPKVFLFDEPLSNLDAALRVATRIEIANLKDSMPQTTMIYVTHDQVEAMTLADRIVVLSAGKIEQVGEPIELYEKPGNLFVARFIGSPAMNIIPVEKRDGSFHVVDGNMIKRSDIYIDEEVVHVGVRPEHLYPSDEEPFFTGVVSFVEQLGEVTLVYLDCDCVDEPVIVKMPDTKSYKKGQKMSVAAPFEKLHFFNANGLNILNK